MRSTYHWADSLDIWLSVAKPQLTRFIDKNFSPGDSTDAIKRDDVALHTINGFDRAQRKVCPLFVVWKCADGYIRLECLENKSILLCGCSLSDIDRAILTIDKAIKIKI